MELSRQNVARILTISLILNGTAFASKAWSASNWASTEEPAAYSGDGSSRKSGSSSGMRDLFDTSPFAPGSNNISLELGQVFLMGNLANGGQNQPGKYEDNIGQRLHYTYGVSDIFGFDAALGYSEHSEGNFSMLSLLTGVRTNVAWYDKFVPYGTVGLGFFKPTYELTDLRDLSNGNNSTPTSLSSIVFGLHLGGGADLVLTDQIFFGAALTFHSAFGVTKMRPGVETTKNSNGVEVRSLGKSVPMELGGTFTSFLLHAGVAF